MAVFDKKICISNIYDIAKKQNIKIGDLEKNANVSVGYLSRLIREGNEAMPSIETLYNMAQQLGCSLNYLIEFNSSVKKSEITIGKFVDKLVMDTNDGKVEWQDITYRIESGKKRMLKELFPLLTDNDIMVNFENYVPCETPYLYNSFIYEFGYTALTGGAFCAQLKNIDAKVYIFQISHTDKEYNNIDMDLTSNEIEIYLKSNRQIEYVANSSQMSPNIEKQIKELYSIASEASQPVIYSDNALNTMNDYLNN